MKRDGRFAGFDLSYNHTDHQILHYLTIKGPSHVRVRMNQTLRLKCHVQLSVYNASIAGARGPRWSSATPRALPSSAQLRVQWMKDGFGYDNDSLWHTFAGRYHMLAKEDIGKP